MNSRWSKILVLFLVIAAVAGVIVYKQYSGQNDVRLAPVVETANKLPEVLYFSRFT